MSRGVITFVFDDGYKKVYENIVPLLDDVQMPGVFAVSLDSNKIQKKDMSTVVPWQKWVSIADRHEIASHSVSHRNLTLLSDEELNDELLKSAQTLHATTIVYPGGAVDDWVIVHAKQYYTAGRTVHYGFETVPPKDPMRLRSYNFSKNNFSLWKANVLALWACITNQWLIETYHMVDDEKTNMVHAVRFQEFAKHIMFVSKLPIMVKTIHSVIEETKQNCTSH